MTIVEHLKTISNEINDTFGGTFVNKIFAATNDSFIMKFSHSKNKSLIISLNNLNPFVKVSSLPNNFSINNAFINRLKTKLLNAHLIKSEVFNDDNILSLEFRKTTDTYDKLTYFIYIELFKANSNIILLNDGKIIDAYRFRGLDSHHPIISSITYIAPKKINFSKDYIDNGFEDNFVKNLEKNYLLEKYGDILIQIKRKIKSLSTKLLKLEIEKSQSGEKLKYKDYGDAILASKDDIKKGDTSLLFNNQAIPLKENYTAIENSQYYYKQYKKAKVSLQTIDTYICQAEGQIDYLTSLLNSSSFYNEQDYLDLIDELLETKLIKIKTQKHIVLKKKPAEPYYFYYNSIKIGFGKNSNQNNILTFKRATKDSFFLHVVEGSGAHCIIFDSNPSDEVIEIACSLALFLSKKQDGDVYFTNIKNVKKSPIIGKVNLIKYETYHINKLSNKIPELISTASRF